MRLVEIELAEHWGEWTGIVYERNEVLDNDYAEIQMIMTTT